MAFFIAIILITIWSVGLYNLGYLAVGRMFGFKLSEFNIGYKGPILASFSIGTTRFQLTPIILGGNVRFRNEPHNFRYLITTLAGPFTVMILSLLLAYGTFAKFGIETVVPEGAKIGNSEKSALPDGFLPGDQIIAINEVPIHSTTDAAKGLSNWGTGLLQVEILRHSQTQTVLLENKEALSGTTINLLPVEKNIRTGFVETTKYLPVFVRQNIAVLGLIIHSTHEFNSQAIRLAEYQPDFWRNSTFRQSKLEIILKAISQFMFMLGAVNLLPFPGLVGDVFLERCYELVVGVHPTKFVLYVLRGAILLLMIGISWGIAGNLIYSTVSPVTFEWQF